MTTRFKDHILTAGTLAARPAATAVPAGSLYPATDTNITYRSNGTAWATWATGGDLGAHLADTVDAHDASAISVAPVGGIAATDVQAALAELDTEKQALTGKGVANGYASLDAAGLVPTTQLPALAITDTTVVATEAAMLALTAERGDVAIRSDLSKSFILAAEPASTLANWKELATPTDTVLSVAGKTGAVSLVESDVTGLVADLAAKLDAAQKGAASGVAPLDAGSRVPEANLPAGLATTALSATFAKPTSTAKARGKQGGALRTFHAALANVAASPVDILCIGDSIVEGSKASSTEKRWQARLRDGLRALFQPPTIPGGPGYYPMYYAGGQFPDPWTYTGGTGSNDDFGLGMRSKYLAGTGVTASFTAVCTSFKLFYSTAWATGSFDVKIDGATVATINTGGFGVVSSGVVWTSAALTRGRHTIAVTPTSATQVSIEGVMVFDGDESAGVRVWDGARSGSTANQWLTDNDFWHEGITAVDPDLVVIGLGRNDWSTNVTPETFKTRMRTLLDTRILAKAPNASIALLTTYETTSGTATTPWADFLPAIYELADEYGAAVVNVHDRLGPGTPDGAPWALLDVDEIHLSDKGSQFYSDAIITDLAPTTPRVRPIVPTRHFIPGTETPVASTNWNAAAQNNIQWFATSVLSSGAVDASITFERHLEAGTWTLALYQRRSTNRGIYTVQIDGVTVGTIDGYAAVADSVRGAVTGIAVASSGLKRIALTMATKNASSSNYYGDFGALDLTKTA